MNLSTIACGLLLACAQSFVLPRPAAAAAGTFARECELRLPRPGIRVDSRDGGYSVDNGLSYSQLTRMGAASRRHGKRYVLGLTRAEAASGINIQLARLRDRLSGRECASPQVVVTLAYEPLRIYVGREFPIGSCSYRAILEHEMRHVRTYQGYLSKAEARIRALLAQRFSEKIVFGERGAIEASLKREIRSYWMPVLDQEMREVEAAQALIDSAEEYERMESVCGGEVRKLLRGH